MEKNKSLNILVYRWKAYNYTDIIQTFIKLGHHVEQIEEHLDNYDEAPEFEQRLAEMLEHGAQKCSGIAEYDFVFTVNYFACISNVCQAHEVKYVCWTCDNPLISMHHKSVFHPCNYIFSFDKTNYMEFREMGVKHIWHLPLAVDTDRIEHILAGRDICADKAVFDHAANRNMYADDIAFVGSLYERNTYDKISDNLPDFLKGYFEATMQAQMNLSGINIIESMLTEDVLEQLHRYFKLEKSADSFSDLGLIFSTTVLGFKIASIQRRRALIELSKDHEVAVYTNSNTVDLLNVHYRGGVDYWTEMPKVFHTSKINLNFTIPNIKSGIPLRVWDVLGAGGFLMTNFQAEIPMYFEEGVDLVCFDDENDLVSKVDYYLTHEEERAQIAQNGYEKVKKYHGYQARIQTMLDTIISTTPAPDDN